MIKPFQIIILFFFITAGCKRHASTLDVNATIIKYHLDLKSGYYDLEHSNWNRNGKIYANRITDSCMIILINKKGDTILTQLDKGIESWYPAKMIKTGSGCFVIRRDFTAVEHDSTATDYKPNQAQQEYSYNDIDYPIDHYYRLDSINKKLYPVRLVSNAEIAKIIKDKFHIKENIKVLASSNTYTYIAKDTLDGSQVYYEIATAYTPQKKDVQWEVAPSDLNNMHKMGIYKNNITASKEWLGNTFATVSADTLGQNVRRYDVYLKEYTKFSCDTKRYPYCHNEFIKLEVVLQDKTKKEKIIVETFTDDTFFENQNFHMFKYKNADYFIGVLPDSESGKEYHQSLFQLDTVNWRLNRVLAYDKKADLNFTRYKKGRDALISGDAMRKMTTFLGAYEIVKVNEGYRLIPN